MHHYYYVSDVDDSDDELATPLHFAARYSHLRLIVQATSRFFEDEVVRISIHILSNCCCGIQKNGIISLVFKILPLMCYRLCSISDAASTTSPFILSVLQPSLSKINHAVADLSHQNL